MTLVDRILLVLAGLAGLLGVAASAAAAHTSGGETLKSSAQFLLFHAPLVVGLVALGAGGLANRLVVRTAGAIVLVGLVLFSGDLALRALTGSPLFAYAAPSGGFALMAGWLLTAVVAFVPVRR